MEFGQHSENYFKKFSFFFKFQQTSTNKISVRICSVWIMLTVQYRVLVALKKSLKISLFNNSKDLVILLLLNKNRFIHNTQ